MNSDLVATIKIVILVGFWSALAYVVCDRILIERKRCRLEEARWEDYKAQRRIDFLETQIRYCPECPEVPEARKEIERLMSQ